MAGDSGWSLGPPPSSWPRESRRLPPSRLRLCPTVSRSSNGPHAGPLFLHGPGRPHLVPLPLHGVVPNTSLLSPFLVSRGMTTNAKTAQGSQIRNPKCGIPCRISVSTSAPSTLAWLQVCTCVCQCMCVCVCVCMCVYVHTGAWVYTGACIQVHVCAYACMCVQVHVCVCTCVHVCA